MLVRLKFRNARRMMMTSAALIAFATVSLAAIKGKGILFPDWSGPTKGSYESPVAELGKKSSQAQPWSVSTVTSSIMGKTLPGKPVSLVGEIIDLSCYLQVGKHGDKHRGCGQKCALSGQPLGLLTKDGGVYMLIDEEHNPRRDGLTTFRKQAIEHMAHIVTVHGTYSEVEGQKAIYVQGYVKG